MTIHERYRAGKEKPRPCVLKISQDAPFDAPSLQQAFRQNGLPGGQIFCGKHAEELVFMAGEGVDSQPLPDGCKIVVEADMGPKLRKKVRKLDVSDTLEPIHVEQIIYLLNFSRFHRGFEERIRKGVFKDEHVKNIFEREVGQCPQKSAAPAAETKMPAPRKRLPRRKATRRKPHQNCKNLKNGLFTALGDNGEVTRVDLALTFSCGNAARCAACASFDRQSRIDDYEYAVASEQPGKPLYRYEQFIRVEGSVKNKEDQKKWNRYLTRRRRRAEKLGEVNRGWTSRKELPEEGIIHVQTITPIPDKDAVLLNHGEGGKIVRTLCNELRTRGERKSTTRCDGGWAQEKPKRKYRRVCKMADDLGPFLEFLKANDIEFNEILSLCGRLYRTVGIHYHGEEGQAEALRERVRRWIKDSKTSFSGSNKPENDTRRDGGVDFSEYDNDFWPEGGREWRETG
jgi:hypothetical protein